MWVRDGLSLSCCPSSAHTPKQDVVDKPFATVTYTEAIKLLLKSGHKFDYPVSWGLDLQSEHERYLSEKVRGRQRKHWGARLIYTSCFTRIRIDCADQRRSMRASAAQNTQPLVLDCPAGVQQDAALCHRLPQGYQGGSARGQAPTSG